MGFRPGKKSVANRTGNNSHGDQLEERGCHESDRTGKPRTEFGAGRAVRRCHNDKLQKPIKQDGGAETSVTDLEDSLPNGLKFR